MATFKVERGTFGTTAEVKPTAIVPTENINKQAGKKKFGMSFDAKDGKIRNYRVEPVNYGWCVKWKVVYDEVSDHDGSIVTRVTSKQPFKFKKTAEEKVVVLNAMQEQSKNNRTK